MSRDPLSGNLPDPKSLHKYLYADGDPMNGIDPTGLGELEDAELTAKEEKETEVYADKFECIDDAYEQLADLEFRLSYYDEGYGASSVKSLQALIKCAKKGL